MAHEVAIKLEEGVAVGDCEERAQHLIPRLRDAVPSHAVQSITIQRQLHERDRSDMPRLKRTAAVEATRAASAPTLSHAARQRQECAEIAAAPASARAALSLEHPAPSTCC